MNRDTVKGGTTIYTKKPFAYVLHSEYRTTRCDNCLKSGKLLTCSNCRYVYYCNHGCQKESWLIHKAECPFLKKVLKEWKVLPDTVRLMARIILKLNQGGADEVDYYTETNSRKFEDLMSHESDIKKDTKRMEEFTQVCSLLYIFFGETQMPKSEELMAIYGRIWTNIFFIVDFNTKTIASGIYLGPSVIDHSCKPNAVVIFDGPTMIIRTLVDLPCLDWSQIRISYVDLLSSNKDRREKLHNTCYFWCDCEKCKQSDPMAEAAACPNSLCDFPYLIDAEECEMCGTKLSKELKERFREVTDFTAQNLEQMKNHLDLSKTCLKKQKNILHRFNVQHVLTLETAYIAALNLGYWEDAELYGNELIPRYLLYYGELYPPVGLLYFMIARTQWHLKKSKEALLTFTKAYSVLKLTHGEEHSAIREIKADLERLFKAADLMAIKL